MIPAAFAYDRASSVDEALALLVTHGADAKIIAGGQSLLPLMKLRLARPDRLIDIGRIESLRGVRELPDGRQSIGALTTYAQLLQEPSITALRLMADALPRIADLQVRNRGTIGGAIAHADPASDMPALLLALGADVVARSSIRGERVIPVTEFFDGAFATALEPDELLTEIRLPAPSGSYASAYHALEVPASGYAVAGVAVVVGRTGGGSGGVDDVRIAVTGVGDHAYRAASAEAAIRGSELGDEAIAAAAAKATEGIQVQGDIHADATYRTAMAGVMTRRALETARDRLA